MMNAAAVTMTTTTVVCDDQCCCCDDDDCEFEAECPNCGEDVVIGEDALDAGYVVCPKCGEKLEFEFEDDEEEE